MPQTLMEKKNHNKKPTNKLQFIGSSDPKWFHIHFFLYLLSLWQVKFWLKFCLARRFSRQYLLKTYTL